MYQTWVFIEDRVMWALWLRSKMDFFFKVMTEKSDYQHVISHSVGTKVVGVCASKQNYAAI